GMAGILMMLLKHRRGKPILPLLESLWPDLRAFKEGEDGREFVEKVTNYALLAATKKERGAIIKQVEEQIGTEEKEEAMTVASALIQEGLERGLRKGRQEGLEKGKLEVACNMLNNGIPVATVAKLTRLPLPRIKKLKP
ncbi:MAG: hypothetical protein AAF471_06300, partial [Myxococcota bacterium]